MASPETRRLFAYAGLARVTDDRSDKTGGSVNGGDDLDRRIAAAQAEVHQPLTAAEARAENVGWAVGIEFVGAVLVAGFIGWLIDRFAGTSPWALIVFLGLGFAAGVRRAMTTSKQFDYDASKNGKD